MTRKNSKMWLTEVVVLFLLSALAGLAFAARGPYSQAVKQTGTSSTRPPPAPIRALYTLQRAELMALGMIAERVVVADGHFQSSADTVAPASWAEGAKSILKAAAAKYIDIATERCSEIARTCLRDVAANEDQSPGVRRLARMLLDAMSPEIGARSFID